MHIAEGFLPPLQAAAWFVASAPFVVHGARAVVRQVRKDPDSKLLLAAAGAFTFALSAVKLPSVTGSSSHPTGTGAGAVLFKKVNKMVAVFLAMAVADLSTYVVTSFQLAIAYPGTEGSFGATLMKFMSIFALTQIPLALAEGVLGVFLFSFLAKVASPELAKLGVLSRKDVEVAS